MSISLFAQRGAPGQRAVAVTPSDTVNLPEGRARSLYINTVGTVCVLVDPDDPAITLNVGIGVLPLEVTRVLATGTTSVVLAVY